MQKVLIIDDDVTFSKMLTSFLEKQGFRVKTVYSGEQVKALVSESFYHIVLTDLRLPDTNGMFLLKKIKALSPTSQVIMMTSYADYSTAIQSIKEGAFNYIPKPFSPDDLMTMIHAALSENKLDKVLHESDANYLQGCGSASLKLQEYIDLVAPTPISVLISGESGTGKEYVANTIHSLSERREGPFVAVDCGAVPKELVASEFFGHLKGAFTGAVADKKGHFEAANGGTLFLDEIGNLSYESQIQLLRALQEREIKPVGSNRTVHVDVRIISASNENLYHAIGTGAFREDLYHRLNEFEIHVPSLVERQEDILLFATHFLAESNTYLSKKVVGFDAEAEDLLQHYHWPGNLRELKNVVRRATLLADGDRIQAKHIAFHQEAKDEREDHYELRNKANEKEHIEKVLSVSGNNKSKAARLLKIDRKTLYNKLSRFNISSD